MNILVLWKNFQKLLEKRFLFHLFPKFRRKILVTGKTTLMRLSRLDTSCTEEHFKFPKNPFVFLRLCAKLFWHFVEKFLRCLSKLHSMCPKDYLGKFFSKKLEFFVVFGCWIKNFPVFWQKNIDKSVKAAYKLYRRTFQSFEDNPIGSEKTFVSIILRHWLRNFGFLLNFFWLDCQNSTLCVQRNILVVWKISHKIWIERILSLWDNEQKNSGRSSKFIESAVKTAFYECRRTIWCCGKNPKILRKMFFLSFWDIELKMFSPIVKQFSKGFSKLHSQCPEENFEEN